MAWYWQSGGGASIVPTPIAPTPGESSVTIEWQEVEGAVSYEVFQGPSATGPWTSKGTTSDTTFDLTGLSAETTHWAGVEATVVSEKGVVSFVTAESVAPTVPSARAIVGRAQSLDYLFGGAGNTAGWWGYAGLEPAVVGPTAISWTVRVKNKTNMTWDKVTFPVLAGHASNASIIGAWIGVGGTNQTPGAGGWQQILFDGVGTKALPS